MSDPDLTTYCTVCHGRGLDNSDHPCAHCHGNGFEPYGFGAPAYWRPLRSNDKATSRFNDKTT